MAWFERRVPRAAASPRRDRARADREAAFVARARARALPCVPARCRLIEGSASRSAGRRVATTRATSRRSSARRSRARAASASRSPSASRCGSTRHLGARLDAELGLDLGGIEVHQPVDVDVARAGDVALPRVARLAVACRRTRRPSARRATATSPSRPLSSSIVDLAHSARTVATSAAIDGRCSSSASQRAEVRGQLDAEHVARPDHPRHERDVREQALADLERLQPLVERVRRRRGGTRSSRDRGDRRSGCTSRRARARASASCGQQRRLGMALVEVLHDHLGLGQHEVVVEDRDAAGRVQLVDPGRPVRRSISTVS